MVADDQAALTFTVAVGARDPASYAGQVGGLVAEGEIERRYTTRIAIARLHQQAFRARVLAAYRHRCAVCSLKHRELIDAAHILPDGHPEGRPVVPNGLALCTLHHSAFDHYVLGVTPDLKIEIRETF